MNIGIYTYENKSLRLKNIFVYINDIDITSKEYLNNKEVIDKIIEDLL